jgi:hypothetical protein
MNSSQLAWAGLAVPAGAEAQAAAEWSIGINLRACPQLAPVRGCSIFYAPGLSANYFYYDDKYWVYAHDGWYSSAWYNGPWNLLDPYYVPLALLQVPASFYMRPPEFFRGWRADAPPRWAEHWGDDWLQHREDWIRPGRSRVASRHSG